MTPFSAAELMGVLKAGVITPELEARWRLTKRRQSARAAQARYQHSAKGRLAQSRYEQTQKGKATKARYDASPKGRAASTRYQYSARGQEIISNQNQRRIYLSGTYRGRAHTVEQAGVIRSHIKERVCAFTRQQKRAEVEALAAHAVSTQTGV